MKQSFEDRVMSFVKYEGELAYLESKHFENLDEYERALNIANRNLFRRGWEFAKVIPIEDNRMIASWALETRPVYMRSSMNFSDEPKSPPKIQIEKA